MDKNISYPVNKYNSKSDMLNINENQENKIKQSQSLIDLFSFEEKNNIFKDLDIKNDKSVNITNQVQNNTTINIFNNLNFNSSDLMKNNNFGVLYDETAPKLKNNEL